LKAEEATGKIRVGAMKAMPKTPKYFAGKTIIITGAASGIGRATALIFAREGANVVCADINEKGAGEAVVEVNRKGGKALAIKVDVTKRIVMEKTFALNVNGTLHSMQALLPHMLANRHGVIVNMASMAHRRGGPGSSIHYAAAKGAVVSITLGVAREFATQGIRALSISPGPIKTPFQGAAQSSPELIKQFLDDVPMQRFGEPEEIGELVLFICSDACEFMTADTIYVNGGGGWR
jgi:NAD(P)-dependent dehydrogenase (short-subunit alcohol dehydrogenase family)